LETYHYCYKCHMAIEDDYPSTLCYHCRSLIRQQQSESSDEDAEKQFDRRLTPEDRIYLRVMRIGV